MKTIIKPSRIYIDLTNACPLNCLHCCTESGVPHSEELSLSAVNQLVDQVYEMRVNNIVFSGGEPMLRPDLHPILEHAAAKNLNITLLTSGILINRDWANFLASLKVRVKVSLDGVLPETHDFLRGIGAYKKLLKGLEYLVAAGVENLAVHFTVHRQNIRELTKLPNFLPKLGIKNLMASMIKPAGRAKSHSELLIPPVMVPYVKQKIEMLARSENITLQRFSDRGWKDFGCPATCNKLGISSTGYVTTCVFLGSELLGRNIREYALSDLWEQYITQKGTFVANEQCSQCPSLAAFGGGCRARALYYHNDLNGTDPYCCALHQQTIFFEKLSAIVEDEFCGSDGIYQNL